MIATKDKYMAMYENRDKLIRDEIENQKGQLKGMMNDKIAELQDQYSAENIKAQILEELMS